MRMCWFKLWMNIAVVAAMKSGKKQRQDGCHHLAQGMLLVTTVEKNCAINDANDHIGDLKADIERAVATIEFTQKMRCWKRTSPFGRVTSRQAPMSTRFKTQITIKLMPIPLNLCMPSSVPSKS